MKFYAWSPEHNVQYEYVNIRVPLHYASNPKKKETTTYHNPFSILSSMITNIHRRMYKTKRYLLIHLGWCVENLIYHMSRRSSGQFPSTDQGTIFNYHKLCTLRFSLLHKWIICFTSVCIQNRRIQEIIMSAIGNTWLFNIIWMQTTH